MDWPPIALQYDALQGVEAKVVRGDQHIDEFEAEVGRFMRQRPYRIAPKREADGWWVGRFEARRPPPILPSIIAGEALGQFRSSLDHLMALLIRLRHPRRRIALNFPICDTSSQFYNPPRPGGRSISEHLRRAVRPEHFALIEGAQPFKQKQIPRPTLSVIREFTNLDKHQFVHAFWAGPRTVGISRDENVTEFEWLLDPYQRLYNGTELYRVRYIDETQMQVPMRLEIDIIIGPTGTYITSETMRRYSEEITGLLRDVRAVTPEFPSR